MTSNRHQFRANWHDYNYGVYFITICCHARNHYFGTIHNGEMQFSTAGKIALNHCELLSKRNLNCEVHNYVVMPNHIHLVIAINQQLVGTLFKASSSDLQNLQENNIVPHPNLGFLKSKKHEHTVTTQDFHHNSVLSIIVRLFKGGISRDCSRMNCDFKWQSRYHEHIIRTNTAYNNIMNYIDNNIINWDTDCFHHTM